MRKERSKSGEKNEKEKKGRRKKQTKRVRRGCTKEKETDKERRDKHDSKGKCRMS